MKKINILGTTYTIERHKDGEDIKLQNANGYHEQYSKKIVVEEIIQEEGMAEKVEEYGKKVLRHEIVHAFFYESGLAEQCNYALSEELVDWIAMQGVKLYKAWEEAGAL